MDMVSGVVVGVVVSFFIMLALCIMEYDSRRMKASQARDALDPVTSAELAELAFPEVGVLEELMCTICLDDVAPMQPARKLSCGHAFHAGCISSWWKCRLQSSHGKVSCPSCRADLKVLSSVIPGEDNHTELQAHVSSLTTTAAIFETL
ncbi:unnamed protein product [Polarella glacialis]|uniref:RING-type domain-containing protein n=1 Tax=Polarella glacialis TaxID=89957 RepID=A0A813K4Y6_POLGL|nr:unnamed protein product [Polarella glacialis]